MTELISGQFTGDYSVNRGGFTYRYRCSICHKYFIETTLEITSPALCNVCFTGQHYLNKKLRRKKLKHKLEDGHDNP